MIRTGAQYREALRDDREVWLEGERVADVTTDRRLRNMVESVAELYDLQHRSDLLETLAYVPSDSPDRAGLSFIEPRSAGDLARRRDMVKIWMDWTAGVMGRSPDFMNVQMTALASAHEYFAQAGDQYGQNIRRYYHYIRENDLAMTHVLINPQTDRSKPVHEQPEEVVARIVKETDRGLIIRGARMISTFAPFADEIAVFPSSYLQVTEEAKPYSLAFTLPVATTGMRFICRPGVGPYSGRALDHPLSIRMDEMDAVVVFDNVLVPWERVFIAGDPTLCNGLSVGTGSINQTMHQVVVRYIAKTEFLLGLTLNLTESIAVSAYPQVQNYLAEMVNAVELLRAILRASEVDCVQGPNGTVLPNLEPLWTARLLYPTLYPRLVEILQIVGASGLVATPSAAELGGERANDIMLYYQAAGLPGDRRIELFRLAWDMACSGFAGRQTLYERYFSGDPWRLATARYQTYPAKEELKDRVWHFIDRTRMWDERLRVQEQEPST